MDSTNLTRRMFLIGAAAGGASLAQPKLFAQSGTKESGQAMKICVFSKHLQWLSYKDMAEAAAEIGFDGVDIPVRPNGHVLPERAVDDLPKAVEAVRKAGLSVPMITTAITGPDTPHAENILKTAGELGVSYYRMGYLFYDDALGVEGSLNAYRPQLKELTAMNRQYNIHGDYQNHSGNYVGAPVWDIWYMLRDFDPRWIGCQYDIRHATVEGGHSWKYGLKLINDFIKTTVIKDFKWGIVDGAWKVINTLIGEGMVDFAAYFKVMKELKNFSPISMHFEYPHERSLKVAAPLFKKDLVALKAYIKEAGL